MQGKFQKGLRTAFLVLCLVLIFFVYKKFNEPMVPEMDPASVPFSKDVSFGAVVDAASHSIGGKNSVIDREGAKKEIDLISEAGGDVARFNLERRSLEDAGELEKLDWLIDYARSRQMKIFLAYQGRESWLGSRIGKGRADWEEFANKYKEDVVFLAKRYQPDYMLILPQCPSGIGRQVNSKRTSREWSNYAKEVGVAVKQVNFAINIVLEGVLFAEGERKADVEFAETALASNDISINVFSMRAGSIDELEEGTEKFLDIRKKYHWEGFLWMGNVDASFGRDAAQEKDFILYSLYLANSNGFSGVILGKLTDSEEGGGILRQDHTTKDVYASIREIMAKRDRMFYSD
jgi:hypothetical protein